MSRSAQRVPKFGKALFALLALATVACKPKDAGVSQYADLVAEAVPAIEKSVGLNFKTPPKIESRTKDQVRDFVLAQVTDSQAQRQLTGVETAYKAFGLIPDTLNLKNFLVDLLEEQIVGYYDPKTKVLYVVDGSPKAALKVTVSHELVHALQDQYINLDSIQQITTNNDRQTAAQSVLEGQAVYEQLKASLGTQNIAVALPGGWERVRQIIRNNQESMPIYSAAPLIIQETLLFPYLSGAEFVKTYKERNSGGGVPFQDIPTSTKQILHPTSAYFDKRIQPVDVSFLMPAGVIAEYENTLGEFETRVLMYQYLESQDEATQGAAAWSGDRYVVFKAGNGTGVAWATVLSSKDAAASFYSQIQRVAEARMRRSAGRTVVVTTGEVNGQPTVLYVDVPKGANAKVIGLGAVQVGSKK